MRILAVLAAGAALMFATAAGATRPQEEADDRLAELLLSVDYDDVAESRIVEGGSGAPFMVANPGNITAIVIGCESRCASIQITLRAAGLPDLVARTSPSSPRALVLEIPTGHRATISNYELDIDVRCVGSDCVRHWALLTRGPTRSLQQRGLPRSITQAEWDAAGETVPLSQVAWTSTPSADDMRFYYPVMQWRANQGGAARLQCLVGANGALRCRPDGTTPFNDGALKLATRLRAPANDANGQPLANRRIVVPIRFEPQN